MTLTYPNLDDDIKEATLDVERKGREYKRARKQYYQMQKDSNRFSLEEVSATELFKRAKWEFSKAKHRLRHLKTLKRMRKK